MEAKIKFGPWPSELSVTCEGTTFKVPFERVPAIEIIDAYQSRVNQLKQHLSIAVSYVIEGKNETIIICSHDHSFGYKCQVGEEWYEIIDGLHVRHLSPYKYYYDGQLIHWSETIYNIGYSVMDGFFVDGPPSEDGIIQLVKGTLYYFKCGDNIIHSEYMLKVNKATVQAALGYRYELIRTRGNIITVRSL